MDKLKFEELSQYLPYQLKLKTKHGWDTMTTLNEIEVNGDHEESFYYEEEQEFKPIVVPFSFLGKTIKHERKEITPVEEILKLKYPEWYNDNKHNRYGDIQISDCPAYVEACFRYSANRYVRITKAFYPEEEYWIMEELFKYHIDVFDFIGRGLGVNKISFFKDPVTDISDHAADALAYAAHAINTHSKKPIELNYTGPFFPGQRFNNGVLVPELLEFIYNRMKNKYNEDPECDYMKKFEEMLLRLKPNQIPVKP